MTPVDFASCLQFFYSGFAQTKLSMNLKFGSNVAKALFKPTFNFFFEKFGLHFQFFFAQRCCFEASAARVLAFQRTMDSFLPISQEIFI